ncbi:Activating signal cointegrator 1 complex subunit 2 [Chelonia mydas]|uniref:Activating signal cointegrator 1 complex subunit 2 n=1 Tax=Chelonia mydas TaxID=8469 RepID=M7B643_CHEMY|nr:Activating signal cointegrator 1 complex subunit 2 [Chelonia mydas]
MLRGGGGGELGLEGAGRGAAENIFTQQSSYFRDLNETVPTILQVFNNVLQECGLQCDGASAKPQKLEERVKVTPSTMPLQALKDIVLYLCDTCTTLWAFLDVFPLACQTVQKHDFCYSLLADLWRRLSHSRKKVVEIFHILINQICLQPILESSYENIQPFIEEFLQIFTSVLQERRFLRDYDELFPVADDCAGATAAPAAKVSGVELDSLISQVKDLLPDLGEGFILACLEEHSYSVEQVIHNILEDRLVPSLDKLERTMPRQVKTEPTPLVTSRYNIFQDDEFDIFSRDSVDMSRVQKGRRKDKDTTKSLLNDKRLIAAQKERYSQYSVIIEEVPEQEGEAQFYRVDYEDEYDDTYDGNQVGANDADSDDELISRRPFTIPQVLRPKGQEEEEEEEEVEETEKETTKQDHFVQDPAVLRERAEARRMTYLARKGYKYDNTPAVVGNVKGHGQSRDTVQERKKKEANKGARANHNRRVMADRKRNKGMIPS